MSGHTPGPWIWRANTAGHSIHLFGAKGVVVMGFQRWGMRGATPVFHDAKDYLCKAVEWAVRPQAHNPWNVTDIDHPDARLIAAAPDLLAALTAQQCFECRQWIEVTPGKRRPCDVCAPALAAIKKAIGETP